MLLPYGRPSVKCLQKLMYVHKNYLRLILSQEYICSVQLANLNIYSDSPQYVILYAIYETIAPRSGDFSKFFNVVIIVKRDGTTSYVIDAKERMAKHHYVMIEELN